jgi:hypothetical protein
MRKQSKANRQAFEACIHSALPHERCSGSYDAVDTRAVLGWQHGSAEDTPANRFGNMVCPAVVHKDHNTSVCRQPECANQAVFHDESGLGQVSLET